MRTRVLFLPGVYAKRHRICHNKSRRFFFFSPARVSQKKNEEERNHSGKPETLFHLPFYDFSSRRFSRSVTRYPPCPRAPISRCAKRRSHRSCSDQLMHPLRLSRGQFLSTERGRFFLIIWYELQCEQKKKKFFSKFYLVFANYVRLR